MKKYLCIFIPLIIGFSLLRVAFDRQVDFNIKRDNVFREKFSLFSKASRLIIGDSRVLNGVDPYYFPPGSLNFGFISNTYTIRYLHYVDTNKPKSLKTIYINLSVQSLTNHLGDHNFIYYLKGQDSLFLRYLSEVFLKPINIWNLQGHLFEKTKVIYKKNGFFSLGKNELNQNASLAYRHQYQISRFDKTIFDRLIKFTKKWREQGICVIFFSVPSRALEVDYSKEISGMAKEELILFLEQNGFKLRSYPSPNSLKYVDGDHLTFESSEIYSKWLAQIDECSN